MHNAAARLQSPLEASVEAILANPEYLTGQHGIKLTAALKQRFPSLPEFSAGNEQGDIKSQTNILRTQLKKMGDSLGLMLTNAIAGDNADYKRLFDAQKEYFKLLAKFNSALEANDRLNAIENATHDALVEAGSKELVERFMELLRLKLIENAKIVAQNG